MHVIPAIPHACVMLRKGYPAVEFSSREAAFSAIRWDILNGRFGKTLTSPVYRTDSFGTYRVREAIYYVLLDVSTWRPLAVQDFAQWLPARNPGGSSEQGTWNGAGPVPGTRCRGTHRGTYFRRPATQSARRMACAADPDDIPPRPKAGRRLPSSWSEIERGGLGDRCWKRYRKTQWK